MSSNVNADGSPLIFADVEKFCKATGKRLCICDAHTGAIEHIIDDNK